MSPRDKKPLLEARVAEFLQILGDTSGGIVVAVSGGPDSVALARAIQRIGVPMVIAHLNHQLRGAESDADAEFVRCFAEVLGSNDDVKYRSERINVGKRARTERENLEAAARRIRYQWLAQIAQAERMRWVVTGHSADDQAETVLHRIIRGTGLKGFRGIAVRRRLTADIDLVRPLLRTSRHEILAYLGTLGQGFREDSSNRDLHFTRNRIRHELLPFMAERFNPAIATSLCRLADEAAAIYHWRADAAHALLRRAEHPRAGGTIVLDKSKLEQAPRNMIREVLRLVWEREGWPVGRMDRRTWDRLAGMVFGEAASIDLPNGIRALARERVLQIRSTS